MNITMNKSMTHVKHYEHIKLLQIKVLNESIITMSKQKVYNMPNSLYAVSGKCDSKLIIITA